MLTTLAMASCRAVVFKPASAETRAECVRVILSSCTIGEPAKEVRAGTERRRRNRDATCHNSCPGTDLSRLCLVDRPGRRVRLEPDSSRDPATHGMDSRADVAARRESVRGQRAAGPRENRTMAKRTYARQLRP